MRRSVFTTLAATVALGLAALGVVGTATAGNPSTQARGFNAEQTGEIEKIMHDYLVKHPEVLVEAMQELDRKQAASEREKQNSAIAENRAAIFNDADSYVAGNPKGDITIVEFFDYQCGYCKRSFGPLMDAVQKDGNIRLVLKEFPILGEESVAATRAAVASKKQGKYFEFHQALFRHKGQLTDEAIMQAATDVGLDTARLKRDMNDPKIKTLIKRNYDLADALAIKGTPGFIIGGRLIPGALDKDELVAAIKDARETCGANC
ncbi:DsbA family protein [Parvibaculum sp.]|uniref:DsbA family protein n=1 Tax=Parvibaculum sp. TaxID=2024848 RepID=UPI00320C9639